MPKTVLVPLDGSRLSEGVLPAVTRLLQATGGKLVLFHSVTPTEYFSVSAARMVEQERRRSEAYLRGLAGRLATDGIDIVQRVVTGEASREIVAEARRSGADLLVMSSHGRSGIPEWPFGSVAERVLRSTTLPVLVARDPVGLRKMMIALDGSEGAMEVLPPASELAAALGAPVVLVHVGRHLPLTVQRAIRSLNRQKIPSKLRLLHGEPVSTILAAVKEEGIDVLAISTATKGPGAKASPGDLSDALLRKSGTSVLTVRTGRTA